MTNSPKVTVVIPVYNEERWILETIESVHKQTLREAEFVFIDDGSLDKSAEIIKEWKRRDPRIKYFKLIRNQGAGYAQNVGIKKASGEYICFLGADDFYPQKTTLETLFETAKKHKAEACDGNIVLFDDSTKNTLQRKMWDTIVFLKSGMMQFKDYHYPAGYVRFIFKKEVLDKNHIEFPTYRRRQDPVFLVNVMSRIKEFYAIKEDVYSYRVRHKDVNWTIEKVTGVVKGFEDCFHIYEKEQLWENYACDFLDFQTVLSKIAYPFYLKNEEFRQQVNKLLEQVPFERLQKTMYGPRLKLPDELINGSKPARIRKKFNDVRRWFVRLKFQGK